MALHNWTRVPAGTFHTFHTSWITELLRGLNNGLLPEGFYAMSEQVAGETGADVLTLHATPSSGGSTDLPAPGATTLAAAPPKVSFTMSLSEEDICTRKRRSLVIRHASGDRVVAYLEILSPGNKTSRAALERFLDKAVGVLNHGYHLLVIDLFPPGSFDPAGIHGEIWSQFARSDWRQPTDRPLTLAAYTGGVLPRAFVEPVGVGLEMPDMPLFLDEGDYVNVPLERTYRDAHATLPKRWRDVLEEQR
ncbi:MAG: DUF4058 family protein [Planctomycetes bacterium]|nr:DUF4058 family protein [Planctomycetota bacterium]